MTQAPILVLNSGSSSLKIAVFAQGPEDEQALLTGSADGIGRGDGNLTLRSASNDVLLQRDDTSETHLQALQLLTSALNPHLPGPLAAVGHRVVHGGPHLREHTRITPQILQQLEAAVHFAPLHIPDALEAIREAEAIYPQTPQIACFDTAFHRTMPPVATRLPIPERFAAQGVQRFGFHGLSCESVLHRLGPHPPPRLVIAHLGGGCSLTACRDGESIDTTMGLTPTGGIPMGTRSGDLDPGILLYLLRSGVSTDALERLLNHECGLAGISGGEADMQALLAREAQADSAAALAIEIFTTAVRMQIGAYSALLGGLDLLVFTGGIGQHSAAIRTRVLTGLEHLGLDDPARILALAPEEEIGIARHCRAMLA